MSLNGHKPPQPPFSTWVEAIVKTVAYVDVFDYPLTAAEIHRYLIGVKMPASTLHNLLKNSTLIPNYLSQQNEFFTLPGREHIVETRQRRAGIARTIWPHALYYGKRLAQLPFVRMVALTGSLAVDNADAEADIDYLIITKNEHLWTARAFMILLVKSAWKRHQVVICPNFILSERALAFRQRTLYTARELAQMIPLAGISVYNQIRAQNKWMYDYLPNAQGSPRTIPQISLSNPLKTIAETLLHTSLGIQIEQWEMNRKMLRFTQQTQQSEAQFSANWCQGHFDNHGQKILQAFAERTI